MAKHADEETDTSTKTIVMPRRPKALDEEPMTDEQFLERFDSFEEACREVNLRSNQTFRAGSALFMVIFAILVVPVLLGTYFSYKVLGWYGPTGFGVIIAGALVVHTFAGFWVRWRTGN